MTYLEELSEATNLVIYFVSNLVTNFASIKGRCVLLYF